MSNIETLAIDPARLAHGQWCHGSRKLIGEGDISASYSADRIAQEGRVRKPFIWNGAPCICVGTRPHEEGGTTAQTYRLVHLQAFDGKPLSYGEKTANADAARADPNGFYHGIIVKHGGDEWVLSGPPLVFVPGLPDQLSLF